MDTITLSEELQNAGLPEQPAKRIARAFQEQQSERLEQFATKADLQTTEANLKAEMKSMEVRLMIWGAVLAGVILAILKIS